MKQTLLTLVTLSFFLLFGNPATAQTVDSLPSWNDGKAKQSIIEFVATVTEKGSPGFVPPAERIAVFDNDGTLWAEQPIYFQIEFALDRVRALAPDHPEWQEQQPFKAALHQATCRKHNSRRLRHRPGIAVYRRPWTST